VVGQLKPEKGLLLVAILLAFLFLVALVPALSVLIGVLIPVPLIFVYIHFGRRPGLVLLALIFVVLFTLMGPRQATLFFTEYAVLASVMAEAIRFRLSFDKCISFSALVSAVLSIVLLLFMFTDREATLLEFFQKQIDRHFAQSIESLKAIGDKSEELKVVQDFADKTSGSLARAYPSFIVLGTFVTALINYYATRFLWRRIYGYDIFHEAQFSGWVIPDQVIWVLIGSSAVFLLADNTLGSIGINLLLMTLVAYFIQGMAITIYFLESRNVPVFFWILMFFVILLQPLLVGVSIGLGVFDTWMDLRKIRVIGKQNSE
jgi:MFS family permease